MLTEEYKITSTDGDDTTFHIIDGEVIPLSNFKLALQWYTDDQLVPENYVIMENILEMQRRRKKMV